MIFKSASHDENHVITSFEKHFSPKTAAGLTSGK